MSYTPAEVRAIEKDIRDGIKGIVSQLKGIQDALPIAMQRLNGHATGTRKMLEAYRTIVRARAAFEDILEWDIKVYNPPEKKEQTK